MSEPITKENLAKFFFEPEKGSAKYLQVRKIHKAAVKMALLMFDTFQTQAARDAFVMDLRELTRVAIVAIKTAEIKELGGFVDRRYPTPLAPYNDVVSRPSV